MLSALALAKVGYLVKTVTMVCLAGGASSAEQSAAATIAKGLPILYVAYSATETKPTGTPAYDAVDMAAKWAANPATSLDLRQAGYTREAFFGVPVVGEAGKPLAIRYVVVTQAAVCPSLVDAQALLTSLYSMARPIGWEEVDVLKASMVSSPDSTDPRRTLIAGRFAAMDACSLLPTIRVYASLPAASKPSRDMAFVMPSGAPEPQYPTGVLP